MMKSLDLFQCIVWFTELKETGVTKDEILDVLEFDSDEYPDMNVLNEAKKIVFG